MVIDIGTGDGLFVSLSARQNPDKFFIGIDANASALVKLSEKIHRKPAKGGLANVLFVQAAVEDLPCELNGVASEVHVNFPWGSLLRTVAAGDCDSLSNLRRICAPEAELKIFMSFDPVRDRFEIERLELPSISEMFLKTVLVPRYQAAGFNVLESGVLSASEWPEFRTSWAQRLRDNDRRSFIYILARASENKNG
ncbi:class I SAM-dependent methyltransferase [candidate division KSB1 bacterium]|nr:class I SAM-dependent methyltransferase [candidate division KSB1 bacterium]